MRRPSARRAAQALAVGVLATSGSMLLVPGAAASSSVRAKVGVLQQAWFWENAYEQANPPVAQPLPATEPSGVPDGDLAVAATNNDGSSSKLSVLSFDVGSVPKGASVSTFTFSLTLDSQPGATSFGTVSAQVVACLPNRGWPAAMPGDYTDAPGLECSKKVAPTVNGSTYTFKVPAFAQSWIDDQNLGVAIAADPANVAPFQLVFKGAKSLKADLAYTTTSGSSSGGVTVTPGTTGGTTGAGGATGPAPAPAAAPPVPSSADAAPPAAAPVVAPSAAAPAAPAAVPVAAKSAPAAPTRAFWLLGFVLALLLLLASLVLGDPDPVAATQRPSRLDQVLRARSSDAFSTTTP